MNIKILFLFLLITCPVNAEITRQQEEADCNKVKNFAANGDKYYKLRQYTKARNEYEQQVAWSESCQLDDDKIESAYNNVALTYIHQKKLLMANAWLNIQPANKKSIFNQNRYNNQIEDAIKKASLTYEGRYWRYSGKSNWDEISIKKEKQKYRFDFYGFYNGLMSMYYGPNIGEFSTTLSIKNGKAHYIMSKEDDLLDCIYDFVLDKNILVVTLVSGHQCGYGHNVSADGTYFKIE